LEDLGVEWITLIWVLKNSMWGDGLDSTGVDRVQWWALVNMVMNLQVHVAVFWVVTPCSDMAGYKCFRRQCCFHHHGVKNQKTAT
jgi:hypothetical protein